MGAGIGGLTAAVALRQAGFVVDAYEHAPELTEVGGGHS
jgi:2-polyprenyl-6-methoxyphenol hydroxylase-like FAD-dependent oxidoreductase